MGIVIVGRRGLVRRTWNSLDLVMLNGLRVRVRDGLRLGRGMNVSGWVFSISLGCGCGGCGGRISFGTFVGYHIFKKMIQILCGGCLFYGDADKLNGCFTAFLGWGR